MTEEETPEHDDEATPKPARKPRAAPKVDEPVKENIIQLIAKISTEAGALAKTDSGGVPFSFRGVDAVVNHLSPILRKYGVVVIPTVRANNVTARALVNAQGNPNGKALTQSDIITDFTFYAPDMTSVTATVAGLAQDHADRSAAQAQSVAFRVALLQVFALPTDSPEPEEAGEKAQAEIERQASQAGPVAQVAAAPAAPPNQKIVDDLKAEITQLFAARDIATPAAIMEAGNRFFGGREGWITAQPALQKLRDALKAGEEI